MAMLLAWVLCAIATTALAQNPSAADAAPTPLQEAERFAQSDAQRAIDVSRAILEEAEAAGDTARQAAALRVLAIAHYFKADFPTALEHAVAAERMYENRKHKRPTRSIANERLIRKKSESCDTSDGRLVGEARGVYWSTRKALQSVEL
ncbi:MAG: hypothetical protein AB8G16_13270 [Gammaproteobacteria bacterium]